MNDTTTTIEPAPRVVRRFRLHDLGCKVNQYETQLIREGLEALGLSEASDDAGGDLFVLNTCSVTESGGAKSRQAVRRFLKHNPGAWVAVTGCYAESDGEVMDAIDGVDEVFGNRAKGTIVPWVARELLGMDGELPELPSGITRFAGHTRAFVKIQDGCRDHCTFCIIPSLRGDVSSRTESEIVSEVRGLVAHGYREVVLTGIHLGYYGWDRGDRSATANLLRALAEVEGLERVKLSSIEVHEIDEELTDVFASLPVLVPHFHLPLQAGSDEVLRRMRRKYATGRFRDTVRLLRDRLDEPCITTDVIIGSPGETEALFEESRAFCEEMAFAKMHIFPYSVRRGTPAADMTDKVSAVDIDRRKHVFAELDDRMSEAYRQRFIGRVVPTLIEDRVGKLGVWTGLSDRFVRIDFDGPAALGGQIVPVRVTGVAGDRCLGEYAG